MAKKEAVKKSDAKAKSQQSAKKNNFITWVIILGVLILAGIIIYVKATAATGVSVSLAKCIGQNSKVYVQTGCSHCAEQESLFGANWQYLNSTDCAKEGSATKCYNANITQIPTWIVNNKRYIGVQSIETLKALTGC